MPSPKMQNEVPKPNNNPIFSNLKPYSCILRDAKSDEALEYLEHLLIRFRESECREMLGY